uniref:Probable RNA-binding protein EIF1AD n=1 Tax=Panagrolaimus davidi TaxID=227884 RepID=A0A914QQV4_9BILA
MSRATKKRFVMKELDTQFILPESNQLIAKCLASRGNNLHEVLDQKGNQYLASMPTKFRNTVWIKRGQYILVESIEEGDKVKAEIVNILDSENILHIDANGQWPESFADEVEKLKRSTNKKGGENDIDLPPGFSDDESEGDENEADESEDDEEEEED